MATGEERSSLLKDQHKEAARHPLLQQGSAHQYLHGKDHAFNYVNKVEARFIAQPKNYLRFLEILSGYEKNRLTENLYSGVTKLLKNDEDLLKEFFEEFWRVPRSPITRNPQSCGITESETEQFQSENGTNYAPSFPVNENDFESSVICYHGAPSYPLPQTMVASPNLALPSNGHSEIVYCLDVLHGEDDFLQSQCRHPPPPHGSSSIPIQAPPEPSTIGITTPTRRPDKNNNSVNGLSRRSLSLPLPPPATSSIAIPLEGCRKTTNNLYIIAEKENALPSDRLIAPDHFQTELSIPIQTISKQATVVSNVPLFVESFEPENTKIANTSKEGEGHVVEIELHTPPNLASIKKGSEHCKNKNYPSTVSKKRGRKSRKTKKPVSRESQLSQYTPEAPGKSYTLIPNTVVHPTCSGQTELCKGVINCSYERDPSLKWNSSSSSRRTFNRRDVVQFQKDERRIEQDDARFELDVAIESFGSSVFVFEKTLKKIEEMRQQELLATFDLDKELGGPSTIHHGNLKKMYGSKSVEIVDGIKSNPEVAIPIVLRRLKFKMNRWKKDKRRKYSIWQEDLACQKNFIEAVNRQAGTHVSKD